MVFPPQTSKRMFSRLSDIFCGFFGLFVSDLEKKNPEALLELEKENLRKQIARLPIVASWARVDF